MKLMNRKGNGWMIAVYAYFIVAMLLFLLQAVYWYFIRAPALYPAIGPNPHWLFWKANIISSLFWPAST